MNWHHIVYYLYKILSVKHNYEIYNTKLLVIVEVFKIWYHCFEKTVYTILILINYNNLKKFMNIIYLSKK